MSLALERLGDGAAFLLQDEATRTVILLACGEVKAATYADPASSSSRRGADPDSDEDGAVLTAKHAESAYLTQLKALARAESGTPLTAVIVTDCRPDACFALPYLTEKTGVVTAQQQQMPFPVVMSHATKALAPHVLTEYWNTLYAKPSEASPLYDVADIQTAFQRCHSIGLKATVAVNEHVKITAYHSGHVAGGCAFYIEIGATTVLFVNDFNLGGGYVFQPAQIPRLRPTAMITRSTFAVTVSETRTTIERELTKVIYECVSADGKVIIPINKIGFFQEILAVVTSYWAVMKLPFPIYVSDDVVELPPAFHSVLKRTYMDQYTSLTKSHGVSTQKFDWKLLQQPGSFVLFTTPANISRGDSYRAVKAAAAEPKNLVVLSEYCKPGTVNYSLYADPVRKDVSKRLGVTISCGVHFFPCSDEVDAKSIVELVRHVNPRQVLLDYVVDSDVEFMKAHIEEAMRSSSPPGSTDGREQALITQEISHTEATLIQPARDIPLRIHKSMFNTPNDVQGVLIAEPKSKLLLVPASTAARRLKKKRHTLAYQMTWKKPVEPSHRVKKKSSRAPSSALSFLLSAAAESADEEEPEEQPEADLETLDSAFETLLSKWLSDVPVEKTNRWFKLQTVCILLTAEWEVHLEWTHEDDELAGRVLGIAKQAIYSEFAKKVEQME